MELGLTGRPACSLVTTDRQSDEIENTVSKPGIFSDDG
jgi:hypothetical protein